MSKYRDRLDKPHIAKGTFSKAWLVYNCLNFQADNTSYTRACVFAFRLNLAEGRTY